ncbi:UNVERIFIED_CONTAM: hypothetical protein FKN15_042439 [Acipenser sinensis]
MDRKGLSVLLTIFEKLPFKEPVLEHPKFVDFQQKMDCDVNDALYFVDRFSHPLPYGDPKEQDKLSDEFLDYQLKEKDIPGCIWDDAISRVSEQEMYHRMDKLEQRRTSSSGVGGLRVGPSFDQEEATGTAGGASLKSGEVEPVDCLERRTSI